MYVITNCERLICCQNKHSLTSIRIVLSTLRLTMVTKFKFYQKKI